MRKIAEIRKDLNAKIAEVKAINPENAEAVEAGLRAVNALVAELDAANQVEAAEQRLAEKQLDQVQKKAGRSFSFTKFIREASEGKLSGLEAEVAEMGAQEYQRLGLSQQGAVIPSAFLRSATGQNAGTAGDGGNLVESMSTRYVDMLKERLVVAQLGATILTDLLGTVPVVSSTGITASWEGEADQVNASKAAFAKAVMAPHRNSVLMAVTKDLLRQTSADVETLLLDMMTTAHAELIEKAAIAGTGANGQPTGILTHASVPVEAMGTNGAALTWAKAVALETKVGSNSALKGSLAYLTNYKVTGACKTTEKAQGTAKFLIDDAAAGRLNGYPIESTNLVPSNLTKGSGTGLSALIFGNFKDLYIGEWGGIDVVVDPYTAKTKGEIEICLNAWNDVLVAEPKSFAIIKDIVA